MVNFTKEELYWIERTADIESAVLLKEFFRIVQISLPSLEEKEKMTLKKYSAELIDSYVFLKSLRLKLENWRINGTQSN